MARRSMGFGRQFWSDLSQFKGVALACVIAACAVVGTGTVSLTDGSGYLNVKLGRISFLSRINNDAFLSTSDTYPEVDLGAE